MSYISINDFLVSSRFTNYWTLRLLRTMIILQMMRNDCQIVHLIYLTSLTHEAGSKSVNWTLFLSCLIIYMLPPCYAFYDDIFWEVSNIHLTHKAGSKSVNWTLFLSCLIIYYMLPPWYVLYFGKFCEVSNIHLTSLTHEVGSKSVNWTSSP